MKNKLQEEQKIMILVILLFAIFFILNIHFVPEFFQLNNQFISFILNAMCYSVISIIESGLSSVIILSLIHQKE